MKRRREQKPRQKRCKRQWDGTLSDLDLLNAGRDPRQMHFAFYEERDPSASPGPGKKLPSPVSGTHSATNHKSGGIERA